MEELGFAGRIFMEFMFEFDFEGCHHRYVNPITNPIVYAIYRVIHKSLRDFRTQLHKNQDRHGRKEHISRYRISPSFFCTRGLGVLPGSTARGSSWRKIAFTLNEKAFCVLEFAKTESIVTVQRRFRIMYHTEPPTDKTVREWYMNSSRAADCPLETYVYYAFKTKPICFI